MTAITRQIHKIDASGRILGRLATEIATLLRGKHKVGFTLHQDLGDAVVVTNAEKIVVTGNKLEDKMYYTHSGYPGTLKSKPLKEMLATKPERVIMLAVKRMLPDNRLRQHWLERLTFVKGDNA
ncbi:MAG: 50S ribosomal protein L13 [Patescibacteria group bacterium]